MASKGPSSPYRLPSRVSVGSRLGAIEENGGMHPDQQMSQTTSSSGKSNHRRPKLFPFDLTKANHDKAPPPYSEWDGLKPGESLAAIREKRSSPRRKTMLVWVAAVIAVLLIIGLVVGLAIGLRKHHDHDTSTTPPSPNADMQDFPAGSYSFTTFLERTQTDCTPNPSTWQCYPYTTINQSTTASMSTFNWVISRRSKDSSNYVVASTENPFAIMFGNTSLSLTDSGLETEAYMFTVGLDKTVIPTTALTSDRSAAQCMYNATTLTAFMYTKMAKSYPPSTSPPSSASAPLEPWPYAVKVSQSIGGGSSVPDCYKTTNGRLGEKISLATESPTQKCSCDWQNFGN